MKSTITKRTLERWRKDALRVDQTALGYGVLRNESMEKTVFDMSDRIIRLTQILLDQELMRREK